jgi:hypothetical protein
MSAPDRSYIDEKVCLTRRTPKSVITAFIDIDGIILLDVLPAGTEFTPDYFCQNFLKGSKALPIQTDDLLARLVIFSILTVCRFTMLKSL